MLLALGILAGALLGFAVAMLCLCKLCGSCSVNERARLTLVALLSFALAVALVSAAIGVGPYPTHRFQQPGQVVVP